MNRIQLGAALAALTFACSGSEERGAFASYKGEPNADDAALAGQLAMEHGRCLYVISSTGTRYLVALPATATSWEPKSGLLRLSGLTLTSGQAIVFGG